MNDLPDSGRPVRIPKLTEEREGAWRVEISVRKYTGSYMLDANDAPLFGNGTYYLAPGIHDFVVERFGGGAFQFEVNNAGAITSVSNSAAATASGSSLALNTTPVEVRPGRYGTGGGVYELDTHRNEEFGWSTAARTYDLVPGLVFVFSNGVRYAEENHVGWFTFLVDDKGVVHPGSEVMAIGGPGVLDLNAVSVLIASWDPRPFYVGASNNPRYNGMTKVKAPVIPGMLTCIRSIDGHIGFFTPIPGSSESGTVLVGSVKYSWKLLPPSSPQAQPPSPSSL